VASDDNARPFFQRIAPGLLARIAIARARDAAALTLNEQRRLGGKDSQDFAKTGARGNKAAKRGAT
jgi:hypothetical protein